MKVKFFITGISLIIVALIITASSYQTRKPWNIPANYKKMKNPVKSDANSIKVGKMLWDKHCKSCHGAAGKGDGVKAKTLKTNPGDFTTTVVQSQLDGELYYESFVGRDEMTNFEKKIPAESDRWHIINFIRSMKK
jgi:mono/diheme cytochrome c family protein